MLFRSGIAMKPGGDPILFGRFRQQITGDLADRELIESHVAVQRINHPVPVGPHAADAIFFKPVGVGIPSQIEPGPGPSLAIVRTGQQPIDL